MTDTHLIDASASRVRAMWRMQADEHRRVAEILEIEANSLRSKAENIDAMLGRDDIDQCHAHTRMPHSCGVAPEIGRQSRQ